jgi:hypothetical protein
MRKKGRISSQFNKLDLSQQILGLEGNARQGDAIILQYQSSHKAAAPYLKKQLTTSRQNRGLPFFGFVSMRFSDHCNSLE